MCICWCSARQCSLYEALCRDFGPALYKIGPAEFVEMCKKDAFLVKSANFQLNSEIFGARTFPILSIFLELAQAQTL